MSETRNPDPRTIIQAAGLIAGPCLALLAYFLLPLEYKDANHQIVEFAHSGRITMSVLIWMGIWWFTEAIDISATALLPLVLLPILGATSMEAAAAPYAHPLIFLFMGGFLIALSMRKWGMDKRVALITLSIVGTKPGNMIGGFMLVSAVLSAFVSNTATTTMMLPIAISVIDLMRRKSEDDPKSESDSKNFAVCLLLGLAYASSIGGISTIIGSAPNALLVGFIEESIAAPYRREVSFVEWMEVAMPLSVVLLPLTWVLLTKILFKLNGDGIKGGARYIRDELMELGPVNRGEWTTIIVFLTTASLWLTRPLLKDLPLTIAGTQYFPFQGLTDAGIAMAGAILLFVIPVDLKERIFTMEWKTANELPWGILILFGGGLSLASCVQSNGVAEFIGSQAHHLAGMPSFCHILGVTATVLFLTELTSNTATTAALLPVLAAVAPGFGLHPYYLIFPAAISSSCAFMMPVATPPNAIVFGSGEVTMRQMIRAGLWLNICAVVIITLLSLVILPNVFTSIWKHG